ncbi:low molecular weight phosphatase family protein [Galbibacter sp. BG1]|uniref:arsenate-mycothiol transferase ArsC n=1 Tax=Galbibacter sp. BG1 TaxID=1170699 RepID=UPI0015B866DC|nr:low molecular weight phosphatase family protein [Galbibacter sp. BG1]QLE01260.1 low molecular weight phosphatase family protein [Galbibacter sp. BG1]
MKERILFLCTGNYYRSRFAELLFNYLAEKEELPFQSFSKGLRLSKRNKGPLSLYTNNYLRDKNIELPSRLRMPIPVSKDDFSYYDRIIAMDEVEHRKLMQEFFPVEENRIEYWSFADDYIEKPDLVLPKLEAKVYALVNQLKK